ncbi:MAG: DM13 domain-containing protein [Flavobacteriaceae bacterium]
MKTIATARIQGPEAIGDAKIVQLDNGNYQLQLVNFWVAPGAPDVQIVFSEDANGVIAEHNIRFIAKLPSGNFSQHFPIDHLEDLDKMKTLLVYCKQFFVHFGHGSLQLL